MSTGERVLIRYRVRPDAIGKHRRLLAAVFAELEQKRPPGFRYESLVLPDGVSVVDLVAGHRPGLLSELETWAPYRSTLDARCDQPPVPETLQAAYTYPEAGSTRQSGSARPTQSGGDVGIGGAS